MRLFMVLGPVANLVAEGELTFRHPWMLSRIRQGSYATTPPVRDNRTARPKIVLLNEPNGRERTLTESEYQRLLETAAARVRPIIEMAWHTGMRQREILKLSWRQVDPAKPIAKMTCHSMAMLMRYNNPTPEDLHSVVNSDCPDVGTQLQSPIFGQVVALSPLYKTPTTQYASASAPVAQMDRAQDS